MTLTLIVDPAIAGAPAPLVLDGRDAVIGRGADTDWALPDPQVSGRHCEIGYRNGLYLIRDTSTNGTLVNGRPLAGIHRLADGDLLGIGGFTVRVREGVVAMPAAIAAARPQAHGDALAGALATLLATRQRQLRELGAAVPDALARNPLASDPAGAGARLAALDTGAATAAIAQATDAIERHHAATVQAMAASLRAVLAEIAPDAVRRASGAKPDDGTALWQAYVSRFDGDALGGAGFVDRFAQAFRLSYEQLVAGAGKSGAPA